MMFGVFLIIRRGLLFENYFPDLPERDSSAAEISLFAMSAWFLVSSGTAWWFAWKKDFVNHERFMIRHVGSGLWIAVQRLLLTSVTGTVTRSQQRDYFGQAGFAVDDKCFGTR